MNFEVIKVITSDLPRKEEINGKETILEYLYSEMY